MPLLETLREFLQANQAAYTHSTHRTAFTAREVDRLVNPAIVPMTRVDAGRGWRSARGGL